MALEQTKRKNDRRWTNDEKALFAEVLVDDDNNFLVAIEKLALKCSSNDELFNHVKTVFDARLQGRNFIEKNEQNFKDKNGKIVPYTKLDTPTQKLHNQLKNIKAEWRKISGKVRVDSGLAPQNEPEWYVTLNMVFAETNEEINLISCAAETSFVEGNLSKDEEEKSDSNNENDESLGVEATTSNGRGQKNLAVKKVVASVHKKQTQVHSNKQALTEIAKGLQTVAELQTKSMKLSLGADEKREERERQFCKEESERN